MPEATLFVYGTLKRGGQGKHLLVGQVFLREAITLPLYRLYDHGEHPCLVEDLGRGIAVLGEIWRVDEDALAQLDAYEEVPQLFLRREIRVAECPVPVVAYLYQGDVSTLEDCGTSWPKSGTRRFR